MNSYYNSGTGVVAVLPGTVSATRFKATARGSLAAPAFAIAVDASEHGMYSGAANQLDLGRAAGQEISMAAAYIATGAKTTVQLNATTIDLAGAISANGDLTMGSTRKLILDSSTDINSTALQFAGDPNTGIYSPSANNLRTVGGGAYAANFAGGLTAFNGPFGGGGPVYLTEGAGAGPAANVAYVYARDTGAKTELVAKMGAAGTIVPLAIEV